jgi:hypothetical protein
VENAEYINNYKLDYQEGEKYPHLERDPSKPDLLEQILKPRVARAAADRTAGKAP